MLAPQVTTHSWFSTVSEPHALPPLQRINGFLSKRPLGSDHQGIQAPVHLLSLAQGQGKDGIFSTLLVLVGVGGHRKQRISHGRAVSTATEIAKTGGGGSSHVGGGVVQRVEERLPEAVGSNEIRDPQPLVSQVGGRV